MLNTGKANAALVAAVILKKSRRLREFSFMALLLEEKLPVTAGAKQLLRF
jgi:hypothetical protein